MRWVVPIAGLDKNGWPDLAGHGFLLDLISQAERYSFRLPTYWIACSSNGCASGSTGRDSYDDRYACLQPADSLGGPRPGPSSRRPGALCGCAAPGAN